MDMCVFNDVRSLLTKESGLMIANENSKQPAFFTIACTISLQRNYMMINHQ